MEQDVKSPHSIQHTWMDNLVAYSLKGGLPVLFFILSFSLGAIALIYTPREEEPQIVVPMADVIISAPGLSAKQIEKQVTLPLEKLLSQITGIEHIYSRSSPGTAVVTLRFFARRFIRVGQKTGNEIIVISGLSIGEKLVSPEQLSKD